MLAKETHFILVMSKNFFPLSFPSYLPLFLPPLIFLLPSFLLPSFLSFLPSSLLFSLSLLVLFCALLREEKQRRLRAQIQNRGVIFKGEIRAS